MIVAFFELQILRTKKRMDKIFEGVKKDSIEELLVRQLNFSKDMRKDIKKLFQDTEYLQRITAKSIHKVGVVRFNPFRGTGGDQSFAIAFLDAKDNGLVVSSLHSREGTRIYTKPIESGTSKKYKLTDEEEEAIKQARGL